MYRTVVVTTLSVLTMLTCGPSFADDIFKKAEKSAEGAVKGAENAATHPGRSAECAQGAVDEPHRGADSYPGLSLIRVAEKCPQPPQVGGEGTVVSQKEYPLVG